MLMIFIVAEGRTGMHVYIMLDRCVYTSQCAREGTELNSTSSLAAGTAQEVGCLFALVHI